MTHLTRITALLAAFAAGGCISKAEVAPTNPVATEASSLYSDMHAAISAPRPQGNAFEYN